MIIAGSRKVAGFFVLIRGYRLKVEWQTRGVCGSMVKVEPTR